MDSLPLVMCRDIPDPTQELQRLLSWGQASLLMWGVCSQGQEGPNGREGPAGMRGEKVRTEERIWFPWELPRASGSLH